MEYLLVGLLAGALLVLVFYNWQLRRSLDSKKEDLEEDATNEALRMLAARIEALMQDVRESGMRDEVIRESVRDMSRRLDEASRAVTSVKARLEARRDMEQEMARAMRRIEHMMAGTTSKGAAGEMLVERIMAQLPEKWVQRRARFGNLEVEFALRLPGGRLLPVDSKWPATSLLERLGREEDPRVVESLRKEIQGEVLKKAREVAKYVDASNSPGFGVAVIPDALFDVALEARIKALESNVAVVSHSLLLPYLLMVYHTALSTREDAGQAVLARAIEEARKAIEEAQKQLESRLSKGMTMIHNGMEIMRSQHMRALSHLESLDVRDDAEHD